MSKQQRRKPNRQRNRGRQGGGGGSVRQLRTTGLFMCPTEHKRQYTKPEADKAIAAAAGELGRKPVRAYRCLHCQHWHLTSRPTTDLRTKPWHRALRVEGCPPEGEVREIVMRSMRHNPDLRGVRIEHNTIHLAFTENTHPADTAFGLYHRLKDLPDNEIERFTVSEWPACAPKEMLTAAGFFAPYPHRPAAGLPAAS